MKQQHLFKRIRRGNNNAEKFEILIDYFNAIVKMLINYFNYCEKMAEKCKN